MNRANATSQLWRRLLIAAAFLITGLFLVMPLAMVLIGAISKGFDVYVAAISERHAGTAAIGGAASSMSTAP